PSATSRFETIASGAAVNTAIVCRARAAPDAMVSNRDVAEGLQVSVHHMAKVHQRLVRAGLLTAIRGPHGGFRLGRPAASIRLIDVVEAIEGPFQPEQCLLGRPKCQRTGCILGKLSDSINQQVNEFLTNTTADQLHR
ncbi:MAG: RrF2 family transcriptional regulator, partial [Capsulimonadaceae bacterium]